MWKARITGECHVKCAFQKVGFDSDMEDTFPCKDNWKWRGQK